MSAARLHQFSQASLQDYADCPRRFELRYLERLHYPAIEAEPALENERHRLEGESFHRLVQQALLGLPADALARLAEGPMLSHWWSNFEAFRPALDGYTLHPEIMLSTPFRSLRLAAKYDLIAIRPGRVLIYDWKTYRRRPREEWLRARMQTRVYRALLTAAGAPLNGGRPILAGEIEMVYWFADFPNEPLALPYDDAQSARDWQALNAMADEILAAREFPLAEDARHCVYCTYRSLCGRGEKAGLAAEAEAGLDAESLFSLDFEELGEIEF
jgi:hypothetical protein